MIGGCRFLTPPDRQETNVSSWSHDGPCTVFMIGGGRFLTPPDRQAPTSYKKGSSRNKCFFMIGGGRFLTPPDRQDFAISDICIIFPTVESSEKMPARLWPGFPENLCPLKVQYNFFFLMACIFSWSWWGELFYFFPLDFLSGFFWPIFFLRFSEVSLFAPSFFPSDFLRLVFLLPFFSLRFSGGFSCSHFFPLDFLMWVFLLPFFSLRFSEVSFFAPIFFP